MSEVPEQILVGARGHSPEPALELQAILRNRTRNVDGMARISKKSWQRGFFSSVITLTFWRWRQQWLLLLVTGLGVLGATLLLSSLPLFSSVMITAGLRTTLRSTPGAARISAMVSLRGISSRNVAQAIGQVNAATSKDLAAYDDRLPGSDVQVKIGSWDIRGTNFLVNVYGASTNDLSAHLQLLQGSLPGEQGASVDAILTPSAATSLGVTIGSVIPAEMFLTTSIPQGFGARPTVIRPALPLRVVGIFQPASGDPYWNSNDFQNQAPGSHGSAPVNAVVSSSALLHFFDTLADEYKTDALFFNTPCQLTLVYTLDTKQINGTQLDDLTGRLGTLQADVAQLGSSGSNFHLVFPYVSNVALSGPVLSGPARPGLLDIFQNQVVLSETSVFILTAQIACLILFFVSVTASTLLERQMREIALLRSRGASRQQIAGSLVLQSVLLCLLAGLLGPLLALRAVAFFTPHFLTALDQDALNALPRSFVPLLSTVGLYVLGAVVVTLVTLILSLVTALHFDALAFRREVARSTRRPLWLRLRLDLAMAVFGLASYGYSFSVQNTRQLLNVQAQELILTPLNLLAPFLLLLAAILFFLRLFPALLGFLARLSRSGRGLSPPLALAQMERTPRQPMRMALLLGLATAFALFTLVFSASQVQRAQDLASYEAGADFSGYLPASVQASADVSQGALARETLLYKRIPGVISASVGYAEQEFLQTNIGSPDESTRPVQLRAVDTSTFARTACWSAQESSQPLSSLMEWLVAQRARALSRNVVPAIVTSSAWQLLHLRAGATFQLLDNAGQPDPVRYLALAEVAHIPPANENMESGLLVDFSTLAAVRARSQEAIALNYAWIQSDDTPAAVAHVRQVLSTQPLALTNLADRRAMAAANAANPLALNVLGTLSVGVAAALLLALLANVLLPILSLRARLTGFAVLRALGTPPRQVARLLAWEQGIILGLALALGLVFGLLLAFIAVPPLILSGMPVTNANILNANAVYLFQGLIPVRVVLPFSLVLALAIFVLLCALALALLLSLALRPLPGQILRIGEDE
jgi:ABC-type antimicrobial peptide transport system permease subunit